jgi:hypothetical protein
LQVVYADGFFQVVYRAGFEGLQCVLAVGRGEYNPHVPGIDALEQFEPSFLGHAYVQEEHIGLLGFYGHACGIGIGGLHYLPYFGAVFFDEAGEVFAAKLLIVYNECFHRLCIAGVNLAKAGVTYPPIYQKVAPIEPTVCGGDSAQRFECGYEVSLSLTGYGQ